MGRVRTNSTGRTRVFTMPSTSAPRIRGSGVSTTIPGTIRATSQRASAETARCTRKRRSTGGPPRGILPGERDHGKRGGAVAGEQEPLRAPVAVEVGGLDRLRERRVGREGLAPAALLADVDLGFAVPGGADRDPLGGRLGDQGLAGRPRV